MTLPTPMPTPEDMEICEVLEHLDSILQDSQALPPLPMPGPGPLPATTGSEEETQAVEEVIEGSVAGEDEHPTAIDEFENLAPKIPETPSKSLFFTAKSLSHSNQVARANNFLRCYNFKEVPETPASQRPSIYNNPLGSISPAPRRVPLRPFWKAEYEHMSVLLEETESKLRRTEYQLYLANKEIARLKEFDGDVHLGLEEIARQRAFMSKVGAILGRGKFEDDDSTQTELK